MSDGQYEWTVSEAPEPGQMRHTLTSFGHNVAGILAEGNEVLGVPFCTHGVFIPGTDQQARQTRDIIRRVSKRMNEIESS